MTLTGYNKEHAGLSSAAAAIVDRFLRTLKDMHTGRDKAVRSGEIESGLEIPGTTVRAMVSYLRTGDQKEGRPPEPICSDSSGYWYAEDPEDINKTMSHIRERRNQLNRVLSGLYQARENLITAAKPSRQMVCV